jgi:hypothetical protein
MRSTVARPAVTERSAPDTLATDHPPIFTPLAAADIYNRIAQRLLALAVSFWHNRAAAEPVKRALTAYDD